MLYLPFLLQLLLLLLLFLHRISVVNNGWHHHPYTLLKLLLRLLTNLSLTQTIINHVSSIVLGFLSSIMEIHKNMIAPLIINHHQPSITINHH